MLAEEFSSLNFRSNIIGFTCCLVGALCLWKSFLGESWLSKIILRSCSGFSSVLAKLVWDLSRKGFDRVVGSFIFNGLGSGDRMLLTVLCFLINSIIA